MNHDYLSMRYDKYHLANNLSSSSSTYPVFFANLGSKVLQICARNFEKAVKSQRFGCQNQRPMTYD